MTPGILNTPKPPDRFWQVRREELQRNAANRPTEYLADFEAATSFVSLDGAVLYLPREEMTRLSQKYQPKPPRAAILLSPWLRAYTGHRSHADVELDLARFLSPHDDLSDSALVVEFRERAVRLVTERPTSPCQTKTLLARLFLQYVEQLNKLESEDPQHD